MNHKILISIILLLYSFFGCKQIGESIYFDVPPGSYAYFGYDTSSTLVVKGWFKIENKVSGEVTGKWHFEQLVNSQSYGPQEGDGKFIGFYTDTLISINLHPEFADNNIILTGKIDNKYIYGKWQWLSFAGTSNWGNFNSKKN